MSGQAESAGGFTPLMRQFHAVKEQHPDKILLFRMGDFYEMFGDDAVKAAPILGIALTSRAHGKGERIPLAGVPYHSIDRYLSRLLARGLKVVVVEQVEDPKTAKGLVKREVVEILTPGTATIDQPEPGHQPGGLGAIYTDDGKKLGLALLDLNTGAFLVDEGATDRMIERLRVLEPSEVLYPGDSENTPSKLLNGALNGVEMTAFENWNFDYRTAERELNDHFGTGTLDGFGVGPDKLAVAAAGAIFRYLRENHREQLSHLNRLTKIDDAECMLLDYSTVRNLELVRNVAAGTEDNTLFSVINRCRTPGGARRLRGNLLRPFKQAAPINRRLDAIAELVRNADLNHDLRRQIEQAPDLERLAGRLGLGKLNPRQAAWLGQGLSIAHTVRSVLQENARCDHLSSLGQNLPPCADLAERLAQALVDEPPLSVAKGGIFRRGYSERLDSLNDSIKSARAFIASLQKMERERTGITSLKVGYNKVFGYYIEVTHANTPQVPTNYVRKQTLVNAERYITPELKEKEELILDAEEKIFRLEEELFAELAAGLNQRIEDIILTGELLSELDVVTALAKLAVERGYCRPEINDTTRLNITNGRHPVVEAVLPPGSFVANDTTLSADQDQIVVLTGPNMSGKSTYLRQIGLIVIMAQIGSFVPADQAEIGLVDRVFTRVGALDNLAGGQSTFLVEMVETANILNNATARSLVLLDEVGRGTSTFDGLSVAWSVVERINESCGARTVFATHYHELTGMAQLYPRVRNYQVAVKRWEDRVVFMHKIIPGGCDDSYGIEVARLAGLPKATITRAKQILRLLESGKFSQSELGKGIYKERVQPSLFEPQPSEIEERLKATDLENMTPVQAFDFLRKLKDDLS